MQVMLKFKNKKNPSPFTKYDLINWFAKEYNFSSYLEISTPTTGHYFDKVDPTYIKTKECINYFVKEIDSLYKTSGNTEMLDHNFSILPFENHLNRIKSKNQKFDVIFIDSFHTVDYTIRDLETALTLVSDRGIIIMHDCFPDKESLIGPWHLGNWCGQTYEGYIRFLLTHNNLENFVMDIDYGCGIIRPFYKSEIKNDFVIDLNKLNDWNYFWSNHKVLLNLISIDKISAIYSTKGNTHRAKLNRLSGISYFQFLIIKIRNYFNYYIL
jgi:hypothetical protein